MSNVIDVTAASWDAEVTSSTIPVVVDFWAPWCGPCRMVAPEIDKLAATYADSVKFVKLNIDEASDLAVRFGVMSIPTIARFDGGEVTSLVVGARGAAAIGTELALGS
jgi:thioredoxin 1